MNDPNPDKRQPEPPIDEKLIPKGFALSISDDPRKANISYAMDLDTKRLKTGKPLFIEYQRGVEQYLLEKYPENAELIKNNPDITIKFCEYIIHHLSPLEDIIPDLIRDFGDPYKMDEFQEELKEIYDKSSLYQVYLKHLDFREFLIHLAALFYSDPSNINVSALSNYQILLRALENHLNPIGLLIRFITMQDKPEDFKKLIKQIKDEI